MKLLKLKNILSLLAMIGLVWTLGSCKKGDDLGEAPRLFRPTVSGDLVATANFIEASWQRVKGADQYTIQISRDTFKTIDVSINVDSNAVLIENLKWDQLYQVQVRANSADSLKNSKFGILGAVKTPRFPSILKPSTINDVTENSAIMRWTASGAAVTEIKVFTELNGTLLRTVTLSPTDLSNEYRIVNGLTSATSYYFELYSGSTLRGYNTYITKAPFEGAVIDLRDLDFKPSLLQDTILDVPSGSTIILKKGLTYNIAENLSLSKTVTITSGSDLLIQEPANIYFTRNFNFENVNLKGNAYGGMYVFNTTGGAALGKLKFENCKIEIFRGITRLQSGTTTVNNYVINNCLIDSISGYGLLTVDNATCKAENIVIKNSTISRAEIVVVSSKASANSITIENSTFYRAPRGGSYLIDCNTTVVAGGIKIYNNIFSIGKSNSGNTSPRGIRATGSTVDATNNYATSDYVNASNPIPDLIMHTRPSNEVFTDPFTNNFKIQDQGFPGRSTAGDPRWRL
jgi:hypothetical protein